MYPPYYSPETSRAHIGLRQPEAIALSTLVDLLQDQDLLEEIGRGNITLAMIRPGLETAATIEGGDNEIAEVIEEQIVDLGTVAKFAVTFDQEAIDVFYQGPKQGMLTKEPRSDNGYANQWEEFAEVMTSGPTTVLLLHTPNGDAVEEWRRQVGHWNIEDRRDPNTIRGRFGINNYNNLIHGSDAPESVLREVGIIAECINRSVVVSR